MSASLTVTPFDRQPDSLLDVPGSRSITNRALVCAALAEGRSTLRGALSADDTTAMTDCLEVLGVHTEADDGTLGVEGTGGRLAPGPRRLFTRLSGTTSRFVLALVSLGEGRYTIDAAGPMRARPMADGVAALRALGVAVEDSGGHLPIVVEARGLGGGTVTVPGDRSSQFLSGLLLVAPAMGGGLTVEVSGELKSRPYVEMTLGVMRAFGAEVVSEGTRFTVSARPYAPRDYAVEPDASSAAYLLAAAVLGGGRATVEGLGRRSLQGDVRFVEILGEMGADVEIADEHISVAATGTLRGVDVDLSDASDQAPTLAAVASFATSPTRVRGVGFIRSKESDRIGALAAELAKLGVVVDEEPDGFVVHPSTPHGGTVSTHDDHRLAMSLALVGVRTPGVRIEDPTCVSKTYPGFWDALDEMGGRSS